MSDRLYQHLIGSPTAELTEDIAADVIADEVASTIRALGRGAENRPLPVDLDWSGISVEIKPSNFPGSEDRLQITVSAPVK